jgi:hypothetical protein
MNNVDELPEKVLSNIDLEEVADYFDWNMIILILKWYKFHNSECNNFLVSSTSISYSSSNLLFYFLKKL